MPYLTAASEKLDMSLRSPSLPENRTHATSMTDLRLEMQERLYYTS